MSLAHLEVNFMQGDGYGSIFILHVAIQCDQHPLFKMLSFLQCVLLPSVSKSSGYESISLYFTSNGSAFLPVQCYRCWWIDFGSCVYRTSALTHWFVSAKQSVFTVLPVCMTPPPSHCSMPLSVTWKPAADVISLVCPTAQQDWHLHSNCCHQRQCMDVDPKPRVHFARMHVSVRFSELGFISHVRVDIGAWELCQRWLVVSASTPLWVSETE